MYFPPFFFNEFIQTRFGGQNDVNLRLFFYVVGREKSEESERSQHITQKISLYTKRFNLKNFHEKILFLSELYLTPN